MKPPKPRIARAQYKGLHRWHGWGCGSSDYVVAFGETPVEAYAKWLNLWNHYATARKRSDLYGTPSPLRRYDRIR